MSKKMMKRSLALGALMAFVITGQAWAAEEVQPDFVVQQNITTADGFDGQGKDCWIKVTGDMESAISGYGTVENVKTLIAESTKNNAITTDGGALTISAENIILKANESYYYGDTSKPYGNAITAVNNLDVNATGDLTLLANNRIVRVAAGKTTLNAANIYMNAEKSDGTATNKLNDDAAIKVTDGSTLNIGDANTQKVVLTAARDNGDIHAIRAEGNGTKVSLVGGNIDINIDSASNWADGLYLKDGAEVALKGNLVDITAVSNKEANGILVKDGAKVILGNDTAEKISINLEVGPSSYETVGIWSSTGYSKDNAVVKVNGKMLEVEITTTSDIGESFVDGILVQNKNGYDAGKTMPEISISEDTATRVVIKDKDGKAVGVAVSAMGGSVINIKGDTYLSAEKAIATRGQSTINIGGKDKDVQIYGDVAFGYGDNSGTTIDANVNINLGTADSVFDGKIYRYLGSLSDSDEKAKVTGMNIALSNGAKWNLTGNSIVNQATFSEGTNLVLKGDGTQYTKSGDFALNGVGSADVLKVDEGALITVEGMDKATYNVATGFETVTSENYWSVVNDNALMQATWNDETKGQLLLEVTAKDATQMEQSGAVPAGTGSMFSELASAIADDNVDPQSQAAADFIQQVTAGGDVIAANNALSNALQMAEAGGNSGTAVTVANNVSSVTTGRMGFSATPSAQKGGNGVGLLAEDSGAAIWAQYVHGKDSVEDMPMSGGATSYEGQFNGVVMGVDFKKVGKFQSGVAFNYGEGDTNSFGNVISTRSDYDFWGVGYYGNIRNEDTNFIFDVNYAKSESDVEQDNGGTTLEASPETTTWSAGVKVEKLYQNNNVQIVPYTGLRFMSVDTDSYKATNGTDTLFNYAPERQDIWLLPLGVSIKQEVTNANGWTVTPKVDLSYIWAFGDTDSEMTVAIPGVSSTSRLGYTVMDDESWLGVVGLEAAKGDWTFGVSYSYQKGDHSENEKWYVDAKYSF